MHYVIINEWELDDQCESGVEVMGVYHTKEEAVEAFKTFVQGERDLADSRGWEVYEDDCDRHDAGALGFYANEHSVLFIAEVK